MTTISMDDLEHKCWECEGKGKVLEQDGENQIQCPKCKGKGVVLTALGQTLLHFVKKDLE